MAYQVIHKAKVVQCDETGSVGILAGGQVHELGGGGSGGGDSGGAVTRKITVTDQYGSSIVAYANGTSYSITPDSETRTLEFEVSGNQTITFVVGSDGPSCYVSGCLKPLRLSTLRDENNGTYVQIVYVAVTGDATEGTFSAR